MGESQRSDIQFECGISVALLISASAQDNDDHNSAPNIPSKFHALSSGGMERVVIPMLIAGGMHFAIGAEIEMAVFS